MYHNVEFNTKKRQESTDKFHKFFFKLLINCVYGKSMENIRKRINVRLINDSREYLKCISRPNFNSKSSSAAEVSIKSDAKKMKDYQISKIIIALYYCKLSVNSLAIITQFL